MNAFSRRIAELDELILTEEINERGYIVLPELLSPVECNDMIALYDAPERFRSKIVMARYGFGQGEYQYFDNPLQTMVASLRTSFYPLMAPIAADWALKLRTDTHYPDNLDAFLAICHSKGQTRPTPLMLKYGVGDFNRLHQDLYGEIAFPLQLAVCLSRPGDDFRGGEFVLTEQRPRVQSRVEVVPLAQGDAVIFANCYRPIKSARGYARVSIRHGVSRIRSGERYCLGIIFHDAT